LIEQHAQQHQSRRSRRQPTETECGQRLRRGRPAGKNPAFKPRRRAARRPREQ
jgi:hypothetical protein